MKLFHLCNMKHVVRCYPDTGELVPIIGNWSDGMQHFGLNDKPIWISLVKRFWEGKSHHIAQVWTNLPPGFNVCKFSGPIAASEAGFYWDSAVKRYYTYVDVSRLTADQVASIGTPEDEVVWAQGLETCPPSLPKE